MTNTENINIEELKKAHRTLITLYQNFAREILEGYDH